LITVTLDGSDGSDRDHRTGTSPIFGSRSFPLGSTLNRALAVNRIACRWSLRDRNRGGLTFGPLRWPDAEAKKFPVASVQVRQGLLQHHRGDLGQPRPLRSRLGCGQPGRQGSVGDVGLSGLVSSFPSPQRVVEHDPGAAERLLQGSPVARPRV
jgi:hypothetical protein